MRDMIRGIEPLANVLWVGLFKIAAQVVVSSKGRNHKGLVLTMPSVVLVGADTGSAEIATPSTGLTALRLGDRSEGGNGFCGLGSGRQRWMKAPPLTRWSCSGMSPEISDRSESLVGGQVGNKGRWILPCWTLDLTKGRSLAVTRLRHSSQDVARTAAGRQSWAWALPAWRQGIRTGRSP